MGFRKGKSLGQLRFSPDLDSFENLWRNTKKNNMHDNCYQFAIKKKLQLKVFLKMWKISVLKKIRFVIKSMDDKLILMIRRQDFIFKTNYS